MKSRSRYYKPENTNFLVCLVFGLLFSTATWLTLDQRSQSTANHTLRARLATCLRKFVPMTQKLYLQWQQCKARNPGLLLQLAGLARELKLSGHSRYSMDGLFHILRWETRATTGDLGLKINNNHTAFAARDLMDQFPDLEGFFKTREQKARGNYGQLH